MSVTGTSPPVLVPETMTWSQCIKRLKSDNKGVHVDCQMSPCDNNQDLGAQFLHLIKFEPSAWICHFHVQVPEPLGRFGSRVQCFTFFRTEVNCGQLLCQSPFNIIPGSQLLCQSRLIPNSQLLCQSLSHP